MKFKFGVFCTLIGLTAATRAQLAAIVGNLDDGTPTPSLSKEPIFPSFTILESKIVQFQGSRLIINHVADPAKEKPLLPLIVEPVPPQPRTAPSPSATNWAGPNFLQITAIVIDHKASLFTWNWSGQQYQAWSNVDFNYLTTFNEFTKDSNAYRMLLVVSNPPPGATRYAVPQNLGKDGHSFQLMQGDVTCQEALAPIEALHEIYKADSVRLHQAWTLREQRRQEQVTPPHGDPPLQDEVMYHWEIKTKAPKPGKGGVR